MTKTTITSAIDTLIAECPRGAWHGLSQASHILAYAPRADLAREAAVWEQVADAAPAVAVDFRGAAQALRLVAKGGLSAEEARSLARQAERVTRRATKAAARTALSESECDGMYIALQAAKAVTGWSESDYYASTPRFACVVAVRVLLRDALAPLLQPMRRHLGALVFGGWSLHPAFCVGSGRGRYRLHGVELRRGAETVYRLFEEDHTALGEAEDEWRARVG